MMRALFVVVVAIALAHHLVFAREISRPPGILAPNDPEQEEVADPPNWRIDEHALHALARISLEARVLGAERYRYDREAALAPVDLALGWGPMSSSNVLDSIDISQSGRFYFWSTDEPLIELREIALHSANMHLIPADDAVRADLLRARPGHLVHLSGWLVEVKDPDGWKWRSSLRRDDSGAGACEVIYVERLALD
jgi:hypothetical protein